jgi:hypothetical protein
LRVIIAVKSRGQAQVDAIIDPVVHTSDGIDPLVEIAGLSLPKFADRGAMLRHTGGRLGQRAIGQYRSSRCG